ncbi:hypothetical protein [Leifsonia soli]|uniref:Uncharacterized protein n=1 Tax=Leifsonia soli TaxID=582665 RepID=A0A852T5E9_9MICO|nr:hypothetical protein [Leifsonia soli]NYD76072.1 hypothetical protein [Leifsonia soli]
MTDENMDVPAFLRSLPVGAVFTHAQPHQQADSWIKIGEDTYRRTYSWVRFNADDFREWTHAELTEPVDYSITQEEADQIEARERSRPGPREMGQ